MYHIKKLNKISSIVYDYLPREEFNVSSHHDDSDSDALLVRSADCHSIELPDKLLAIARAGAGVNNIPIDKCTEKGVVVFNTPGANANGVKELVLCGMLMASRNILEANAWVKTLVGEGDKVLSLVEKGKSQFVGPELKGKTLGVFGLGAIGVMVANAANSLGMNVIGYDPFISVESAWMLSRGVHRANTIDELLVSSDFISMHIPLMDKTRDFISSSEISKMKEGVVILNFARNGLIRKTSLYEALETGKVSRFVTDFPEEKSLENPHIICIPHLGASTPESEENCAQMAAEQLHDYIKTGSIVNSVNFPECLLPTPSMYRVIIIHKNLPNMVGQISMLIASKSLNISEMVNKSRKDIAFSVFDLDTKPEISMIEEISKIDGVMKVREIF